MVFVKKWPFSIVCVFLQNKAKKMFRDIPDGKECFLDKKSKVLKKFQKIPIFARKDYFLDKKNTVYIMAIFQRD